MTTDSHTSAADKAKDTADKAKETVFEEFKVRSNQLVDKVKEIAEEGNARRIIIKRDGKSVLELPLSIGVGGAAAALVISPTLAAIGAFASLVSEITVTVERERGSTETKVSTTHKASGTSSPGAPSGTAATPSAAPQKESAIVTPDEATVADPTTPPAGGAAKPQDPKV